MKIHPNSPATKSKIKREAAIVGLDLIDYNELYKLVKVGSKDEAEHEFVALIRGTFQIVGAPDPNSNRTLVWLAGTWVNGDWYKTSPVLKCMKSGDNFVIETENSFYELRPS
jgi:hypothetical protein